MSLRRLEEQEGKGIRGAGTACAKRGAGGRGGTRHPLLAPCDWKVVAEEGTEAGSRRTLNGLQRA